MKVEYSDLSVNLTFNEAAIFHSMIQVYIDSFIHSSRMQQADIKLAIGLRDRLRKAKVPKVESFDPEQTLDAFLEVEKI